MKISNFIRRVGLSECLSWVVMITSVVVGICISSVSISDINKQNQPKCSYVPNSIFEGHHAKTISQVASILQAGKETLDICISKMQSSFNQSRWDYINNTLSELAGKGVKIRIFTDAIGYQFPKGCSVRYFSKEGFIFRMNFAVVDDAYGVIISNFGTNNAGHIGYAMSFERCASIIKDMSMLFDLLWEGGYKDPNQSMKHKWVAGLGFPKWHKPSMTIPVQPFYLFHVGRENFTNLLFDVLGDTKSAKVVVTSSLYPNSTKTFSDAYRAAVVSGLFETIPFNEQSLRLAVPELHYREYQKRFDSIGQVLTNEQLMYCNQNVEIDGTIIVTVESTLIFPIGLGSLYDKNIATMGLMVNSTNYMSKIYILWKEMVTGLCQRVNPTN